MCVCVCVCVCMHVRARACCFGHLYQNKNHLNSVTNKTIASMSHKIKNIPLKIMQNKLTHFFKWILINSKFKGSSKYIKLFQSSGLNQLSVGEWNSEIDSAIIICSFEHMCKRIISSYFHEIQMKSSLQYIPMIKNIFEEIDTPSSETFVVVHSMHTISNFSNLFCETNIQAPGIKSLSKNLFAVGIYSRLFC